MKKPKRSDAENISIIETWQKIQAFALEHPAVGQDNKPLPNHLVDQLYIAGVNAAKALQ